MTKHFQECASGRLEVCDWGTNEADVALASRHCIQLEGLTMTMLQNCLFLMCEQVCQACTDTRKLGLEATIETLQTGGVSASRIERSNIACGYVGLLYTLLGVSIGTVPRRVKCRVLCKKQVHKPGLTWSKCVCHTSI